MAAESYRPITTQQEPGILGMPRTYTSSREVASETNAPARGSVLGAILGPTYAAHIVLSAEIVPKDGKRILTVQHCSPPDWTILLGSVDRKNDGLYTYTRQVIPTPTQAQIDANFNAVYEPIDETKSYCIIKTPRKKNAQGVYDSGYPKQQVKTIGIDNLTPAKFRGQTVTVETTTTETLAAADVDDIPAPALTPESNETKIVHQKISDEQYLRTVTTEIIDENVAPLLGEEYGDIVTKSTEESLVVDGTAANTGMEVMSSVVEPIGNGKSIKQTKTVKGGVWPNPYEQDLSLDPPSIPSKLRRSLKRVTSKKKIGAIPAVPALGVGQVGLSYKQETPDRVDETVTTESLDLSTAPDEVMIEQKPFVKITATTKAQSVSAMPVTGNGSSKMIYDNGVIQVWDNTAEVAEARSGTKGIETRGQQWGQIVETINYSTDPNPTAGGSSSIVFSDGALTVYEVSAQAVTVNGTKKDIDAQSWGKLTWNGTFATTTSGDRSNQVWSNGVTRVYLNESAVLEVSGTSKDVDAQSWGKLTWNGTFGTTSSGDKSRQVYNGPGGAVFLNESAVLEIGGTSKDVDFQQWGKLTWDGTYNNVTSGERSRQVYNGPGGVVFLNENVTPTVSGSSKDIDPQQWGFIVWDGTYSTTASAASGTRVRQVWSNGTVSVFLNETPTLTVTSGQFTSAREENTLLIEEQKTEYGTAPISGNNTRSRLLYSIGTNRVYENITIIRTAKVAREYQSVITVDFPPELVRLDSVPTFKRDGSTSYRLEPLMRAGYRGPRSARVVELWSESPAITDVPAIIRPEAISFQTPIGGIGVSACLHRGVSINWMIGTSDPDFFAYNYIFVALATTPGSLADLGEFLYTVDSQPYKDGYVVRKYYVEA